MGLRYNVSAVSGNANTLIAGSVIAGNAVFMGQNFRKVASLVAIVSFTAATSTLTATGKWQGSNDNATWIDLAGSNAAANVTFATGTAAIVTKGIDAPLGAYGWKYVRFCLVVGVATGNVGDLYSIGYSYRQLTGAEGMSRPG
jgi:hypothetical protein